MQVPLCFQGDKNAYNTSVSVAPLTRHLCSSYGEDQSGAYVVLHQKSSLEIGQHEERIGNPVTVMRVIGKGFSLQPRKTMGRRGQRKDGHWSRGRNGCGGSSFYCGGKGCRSLNGNTGFVKVKVAAAVAAGLMLVQKNGIASAAQIGNLTGTVYPPQCSYFCRIHKPCEADFDCTSLRRCIGRGRHYAKD